MKTLSLSGSLRENVGKRETKLLRKEDRVPCVLYGGEKQVHFSLSQKQFSQIIFTQDVFVLNFDIDGVAHKAILQDIQYHPVSDIVLHADFLEVNDVKPIIVSLPTAFEGVSKGVLNGGRLQKKMRKVRVKGLISDLPEILLLNISALAIGDSIRIKDVKFDNIEFLDHPSSVVVSVKTARGVLEDEEEEGEEEEGEETAASAE